MKVLDDICIVAMIACSLLSWCLCGSLIWGERHLTNHHSLSGGQIVGKTMRSVTIIFIIVCCTACRTPKKVVEDYQRVDSLVMNAEHSAISVEQIIEDDTISTQIVVEQLDTLGRVTNRATIVKQRKKNILSNKIDTAFLQMTASRQEQAAIHVEQTPERARAWTWVLGLICLSCLIGLFWFLGFKGR